MASDRLVTAIFPDRETAEMGYSTLTARGYKPTEIDLVMTEDTKRSFAASGKETELGNKAAKGAGVGGAIGGTVGAIAAAIAAAGTTLAIPGLGILIAGPIAGALAGAGAGAASGGLVGALVGWSIPEERVKRYEEGVKKGGILMGVHPRSDDDATYFANAWKANGAQEVYL
jgi:hypothetical protein